MTKNRLATLVRLLYERTQEGGVFWENVEDHGVFEAAFEEYALRVSQRPNPVDNLAQDDFFISVCDRTGTLLDEFDYLAIEADLADAYERMKDIYQMARRNALGVDHAVEHIIAHLSDG